MDQEITLNIYLSAQCNLNCSYCYVTKNQAKTDLAAIKERLNYFFTKNSFLFINFLGGEPLLTFAELQSLVDYIEANSKKYGFGYELSLVTNGTLLTAPIFDYLQAKKMNVILSLDGEADNTPARKFKEQKLAVTETVLKNLRQLPGEDVLSQIQISKVITPENLPFLLEDFKFLNLAGFKAVDLQIELYRDWTPQQVELFKDKIKGLFDYYQQLFDSSQSQPLIKIGNFNTLQNNENHNLFNCEKFRLNYDGSVFLCLSSLLDEKYLKKHRLEQTTDWDKAKRDLIATDYEAINKLIEIDSELFCPLDLFIYAKVKNKDFMVVYTVYAQLYSTFDQALRTCWQELQSNQRFKEIYGTNI